MNEEIAESSDQGAWASLWGMLFSPERTAASLARRPRWLLPLALLTLLGVGLSAVVTPKLDMRTMMREAMEKQGLETDTPQFEKQVEVAEQFGWIGTAAQGVIQPAVLLLIAVIFLALFRLFGSDIDFRQSLSVTTHAFVPNAVAALLAFPVVMSRETLSVAEIRSGGLLKSNLAVLAPESTAPGWLPVLSSIDLFSLWTVALFAVGYRVVGRVSRGQAWGVVIALWVVYVGAKSIWTAIF